MLHLVLNCSATPAVGGAVLVSCDSNNPLEGTQLCTPEPLEVGILCMPFYFID